MNKRENVYHPWLFYIIVFIFTWAFWISGIFVSNTSVAMVLIFLGLCVPSITAVITVFSSKNKALINDFKRKTFRFYQIKPLTLGFAIIVFGTVIAISILLSTLFGQSLGQFSFVNDFSFSIKGSSALLTILFASIIEEVGWRGYGEDAIAQYCTWFKESIIFGFIWSAWHVPLFFIEGTYHAGLAELGAGFVLNFLISVIPLGFITTWVYVKNNRSMLACIIFHLFVNFFQEKIAMSPQTKCIQTFVLIAVATILVMTNKELFFEKRHIGAFPENI